MYLGGTRANLTNDGLRILCSRGAQPELAEMLFCLRRKGI